MTGGNPWTPWQQEETYKGKMGHQPTINIRQSRRTLLKRVFYITDKIFKINRAGSGIKNTKQKIPTGSKLPSKKKGYIYLKNVFAKSIPWGGVSFPAWKQSKECQKLLCHLHDTGSTGTTFQNSFFQALFSAGYVIFTHS